MNIQAVKIKMTQIFKEDKVIPVTLVLAEVAESLKEGDSVKVSGITKGKGFQGVVKRWGFSGGPKTHGQKNRHRAPGSIGNTSPQRVIKGRRMAGRTGGKRVTLKMIVEGVDKDKKMLFLKGSTPGNNGSRLKIKF